jgi:hypothetical protein
MHGRFLQAAVDKLVSADDSRVRYRPQGMPANRRIDENAGDAVGILRCSSGKANVVAFSVVQPHRREVLKGASNDLCSRRMGTRGRGAPTRFYEPSKRLLRASASGDGVFGSRPGANLPPTPPPPLGLHLEGSTVRRTQGSEGSIGQTGKPRGARPRMIWRRRAPGSSVCACGTRHTSASRVLACQRTRSTDHRAA